eukprot:CAMPEP_0181228374 /NCGR_PEP_ID=MMETSP1096-20121128/33312_1 /TAXON_ID=156174 ORGANISM="Chrysochromulina ericina, Strain CCMP281" /NCGR_SAMPLE_ID=MMETSP1096 /ASSEMBLY_ACC=CAM_ASM_000453 /LENGTH=341 /DNA_ID=CAMNT_0023321891 /DNA_START=61 /DNA_END=1082 /DNA_ORIENTATION=+
MKSGVSSPDSMKSGVSSPDSIMAADIYETIPKFQLPPAAKELRVGKWRKRHLAILCTMLCLTLKTCELVCASASLVLSVAKDVTATSYLTEDMKRLIWRTSAEMPWQDFSGVALAGFAAQLVDGSLGMGYGVTSSSMLVAWGLSPTVASASVHLAQLGTTAASGLAHFKLDNVDLATVRCISPSGVIGAFIGAMLLSSLPAAEAKTCASVLLFSLGAYILARFHGHTSRPVVDGRPNLKLLAPIGLIGGFVDATGGGGWGPVATSALLADGRLTPCRVIGTVSASEFFVTIAAVCGFLATLGTHAGGAGVRPSLVVALLLGGLLAAPIAPRLVTRLEPNVL